MSLSINRYSSLLLMAIVLLTLRSIQGWVPSQLPLPQQRGSRLFMSDDVPQGIQKGTVKWFNTVKGFGFIQPDDGSSDVFVHQTEIQMEGFRSLADGEKVEYEVQVDNAGRKKAVQVTGPEGVDVQGAPFQPRDDYGSY